MPADQAYNSAYQLRKYHDRRALGIARLGAVCARCGTTDDLQFDHIDPATKSFDVAKSFTKPLVIWLAEADKCQLLCGSCHRSKTSGEQRNDVHGTWGMVRNRGCKCDVCKEFRNAYHREWRRKRRDAARS